MFHCEPHSVRAHDLLEIDTNQLIAAHASAPEWVEGCLRKSPFVIVRRGRATKQEIPVGVRGAERNQRWGTFCHPRFVKSILTPAQLLRRTVPISRANVIPAFRALNVLKDRWTDLDLPWGPGGSVGFELATGNLVANPQSDLDIIIYVDRRMPVDEAKSFSAHTIELPAVADLRVETPVCGFSLTEYAQAGPTAILLRTPVGHVLGSDPWSDELKIYDTGQAVGKSLSAL
jgi:phosphoribosyl-dephospho-CoA transferase